LRTDARPADPGKPGSRLDVIGAMLASTAAVIIWPGWKR
jgi:hypothetical protein